MIIRQNEERADNHQGYILLFLTAFYFFFTFFEPYLNQRFGALTKYYILLLVILFVLKKKGLIQINPIIMPLVVWFIYLCCTLLWSKDDTIAKLHFFTICASVIFAICLIQTPVDRRWINYMVFPLWIGSFLIGFLSMFSHTAYVGVEKRQVLSLFGYQTDPNNQAIFLMFGISIALYYMIVERRKILFCIATVVVSLLSILMTASRGAFLSVGIMIAIIFVFILRDWKLKVLFFIALAVLLLLVYRYIPSIVSSSSMERLTEFDTYEGGGARLELWTNAFKLCSENPIYIVFGAGWGTYNIINTGHGMHNTYVEIFSNTGMIGLCLFFYPIVKCLIFLMKRKKYLPIFIAISVLLPCFFIDCINKRFFWNAIYFILVSYLIEVNDRDNEKISDGFSASSGCKNYIIKDGK